MLVALFFGQAYQTLLPYFAEKVFDMGPRGYSTFVSVVGIGSLLAPLLFASLGEFRGKGLVIVGALFLEGAALTLFAFTPWLIAAFLLMGAIGFVDSANRLVSNSLLLTRTERAYHGRIMSLLLLDRGFVPFGSLIAGFLLDAYGGTVAMLFMGIGLIVAVLLTAGAQVRFLRNA
jgi:predicted MFS family arabinose efflux permease